MQMRHSVIAMMALTAGIIISGAPSHAAPRPVLEATAWSVAAGMIQKVDYWHHYCRRHGVDWHRYYRHHLAPVRPLSCGEFRFWNGEHCVDIRFR